jgi:hypothetical protein
VMRAACRSVCRSSDVSAVTAPHWRPRCLPNGRLRSTNSAPETIAGYQRVNSGRCVRLRACASNPRSFSIASAHKLRAEATCEPGSSAPQHVICFGPALDFGMVPVCSTAREADRGPYLEAGRAGSIRRVRFCWRHSARRVLSFLGSPTSHSQRFRRDDAAAKSEWAPGGDTFPVFVVLG